MCSEGGLFSFVDEMVGIIRLLESIVLINEIVNYCVPEEPRALLLNNFERNMSITDLNVTCHLQQRVLWSANYIPMRLSG